MQVKSIAECSLGAFCNTFELHLATNLSLRHLLCLFLSGRFREVLLYLCHGAFSCAWIIFYNSGQPSLYKFIHLHQCIPCGLRANSCKIGEVCKCTFKAAYSITMNIFRKKLFSF